MRIIVKEENKCRFPLELPNRLALNGLSAGLICSFLRSRGVDISGKQLRHLFRVARKYAEDHPQWKLVEVTSADGDVVEIVM